MSDTTQPAPTSDNSPHDVGSAYSNATLARLLAAASRAPRHPAHPLDEVMPSIVWASPQLPRLPGLRPAAELLADTRTDEPESED